MITQRRREGEEAQRDGDGRWGGSLIVEEWRDEGEGNWIEEWGEGEGLGGGEFEGDVGWGFLGNEAEVGLVVGGLEGVGGVAGGEGFAGLQ